MVVSTCVEDVVVAGGWISATGVAYASIGVGSIGVAATCVEMLLLVLEVVG